MLNTTLRINNPSINYPEEFERTVYVQNSVSPKTAEGVQKELKRPVCLHSTSGVTGLEKLCPMGHQKVYIDTCNH